MAKNGHVKRRNYITTLMEVAIPVLVMLIIVAIRSAVSRKDKAPEHYYESEIRTAPRDCDATDLAQTSSATEIVFVTCMEQLAVKLLRRGHQIAVSPNVSPFYNQSDPDSFSSHLSAYINRTKSKYSITDTREDYVRGFTSLDDMDAYVRDADYPSFGFLEAGVGFRSGSDLASIGASYSIRMNQTGGGGSGDGFARQIPNTVFNLETDALTVALNVQPANDLFFSGFLALQDYIDEWVIGYITGTETTHVQKAYVPFPTPEHTEDQFASFVSDVLPLFFVLAYLWPITRILRAFIEEKEFKIKEGLRMVGMYTSAHFWSWFITYSLVNIISAVLITLSTRTVFRFSSPGIVFFFFFLYGEVVIAYCWLVSSLFSRTRLGSTMGALLFLALFFPVFSLRASAAASTKLAACLSPPICFGFGAQTLIQFESVSQGVTGSNIDARTSNFSMSMAFLMLIADFFLFLALAVYCERVVPSEWGVELPPWFFCLPSWWCDRPMHRDHSERKFGRFYEIKNGGDNERGISLYGLFKRFPSQSEDEAAVRGIDMDMYRGQITALLGHNGAGKTTCINLLTGVLPPTSGDALVFGRSILSDMSHIRADLGVCPQHNVLWDDLTVEEHLWLIARLKFVRPRARIRELARSLIEEVGLTEKTHITSRSLSGGMKRKLCLAMALAGGSHVIFLDEPTSGMDPYSRRSTWDMLKRAKPGRVVILTTHFMDEADYLGDRIAIMHRGLIVACGSSLFLKNRYGVGYTMTVTKKTDAQSDAKAVAKCILKHVPKAKVVSQVAGEVQYQLPKEFSSHFADLFDEMDLHLDHWGVDAYSISVTSLEEVFLRVGRGSLEDQSEVKAALRESHRRMSQGERKVSDRKRGSGGSHADVEVMAGDNGGSSDDNDDAKVNDVLNSIKMESFQEVHARKERKRSKSADISIEANTVPVSMHSFIATMLAKRWHTAKRNKSVFLWQIVYPTLIIVAGIGLLKLGLDAFRKDIDLSTGAYNMPNRIPLPETLYAELSSINRGEGERLLNATTPLGSSLSQDTDCQFGEADPTYAINMSRYLLCKWKADFPQTKYGAFASLSANANDTRVVFHNTTGTYATGVFLNLYNRARVRNAAGGSSDVRLDAKLTAWPRTKEQRALSQTFIALIVAIAFAFMPASIAGNIVHERQLGSKHLQILSGVPLAGYWVANFIWDFSLMMPSALLSLAWYEAYEIDNLVGEAAGAMLLSVLLFGLSVTVFTYVISFGFSKQSTAQNVSLLFYIVSGGLLLVASIVLDFISSTRNINKRLKFVYRLLPSFCLGEVVINLLSRESTALWSRKRNVWDREITGYPLLFMALEFVGYTVVLIAIEFILSSPRWYAWVARLRGTMAVNEGNEAEEIVDREVLAERKRVASRKQLSAEHLPDEIRLEGLRKVYPGPKVAVKDMWFGVPKGQCFGFLGINGAGKTTTLKMLTGDVLPTRGTATLHGFDVLSQQRSIRRHVGYCPQFDALLPLMTGRETLLMFSRIKGVLGSERDEYVTKIIDRLTLTPYADKPVRGYSGGNKRKLSVGVALVGGPSIVFLDEPSTGMDPGSRRFLWNLIAETLAERSVILTTHSMEESEALCSRIGIMVDGRLKCIGSIPHLKARFASGYQIDVKVRQKAIGRYKEWIRRNFPDAKLLEDQQQTMTFQVCHTEEKQDAKKKTTSLGSVFRLLESNRESMDILEYSVSETSLEQIFIRFARTQTQETGERGVFAFLLSFLALPVYLFVLRYCSFLIAQLF